MADLKETVPFSFDEIYKGIADKFADKGYDSPYDGSNLAQLITSMAYTTSMLNANTAININETILTLAQKRPNIIQDARLLGYEAQPKISYIYELEIEFLESRIYTVKHLGKFSAGGLDYYYMGDDFEFDATKDSDDEPNKTTTIRVKQGELITYEDEPENLRQVIANQQYLDIPYTDIEADGIETYVTYYTTDGILAVKTKFFKSDTLLLDSEDNLSRKFIRLENIEMNTPRIYFVLSDVGDPVPTGAIVEFNVLISKGPDGAMADNITTELQGLQVNSKKLLVRGTSEEENQSIRDNAPVLHNTAGRCVTANDYSVVCRKHSAVQEAYVFGGEEEHPVKLGNVFLCMTPEKMTRTFTQDIENTEWVLDVTAASTSTLEEIQKMYENMYLLDYELMSVEVDNIGNIKNPGVLDTIRALNLPALKYNIRNPQYIFMNFDIKVIKYALSSVHKDVRQQIFNILDAHIEELETFETEFFKSNPIKKIDEYLTDITGLELDVNFRMLIDKKSISEEIEQVVENDEIVNRKAKKIHLYLDTPFEGLYEDNGYIKLNNLPKIDTPNFIEQKDLIVDFDNPTVVPDIDGLTSMTKNKQTITFNVYLANENIGKYIIYNDRTTYIKIMLHVDDFVDSFDKPRFMNLEYPSKNMKILRTSTFKLNEVKIH